ncbi:MAG: stage III sporulation protein AB [Oscillospiraceae bacterium]|nr:stage III sporulation protein AB [Oscillospiraceae bacterium]
MIRLLLNSAIVVSCFLISLEKLNSERRKIQIAKELENVIFQLEALIKYGSYDVYQLCERCFSDVTAFDAGSFVEIKDSFSESFLKACEKSLETADKSTKSAFMKIADFLGMFESDTQIAGLENVLEEIKSRRIAMENELAAKRKIYLCLGAFSGIVICLVLM